jgi:hypothetical protein
LTVESGVIPELKVIGVTPSNFPPHFEGKIVKMTRRSSYDFIFNGLV